MARACGEFAKCKESFITKLSAEARKVPPDLQSVREARSMLEDLNEQLREPALWEDVGERCLYPQQTKLWLLRAKGHLRMAESMLR